MLFLVDYENVRNNGMRGCERLGKDDIVILFYSEAAFTMETHYLEEIEAAECHFEIIKLVKKGKNALDFYIASHLGRLYGEGYKGEAVIVSKDTGFSAIRDYWLKYNTEGLKIYISPSIERGILDAGGNTERVRQLRKRKEVSNIEAFYAGYQERGKIHKILKELFENTEYEERTEEICELVEQSSTAKVLYINMLKTFGRENGLKVYGKLKRGWTKNMGELYWKEI